MSLTLKAPGLGEIAATDPRPIAARRARRLRPASGTGARLRPQGVRRPEEPLRRHACSELLYLGDVTLYKVELANGFVIEALMANAAPGRAKFHEVGDPVAVCWRHDAGVYLRE